MTSSCCPDDIFSLSAAYKINLFLYMWPISPSAVVDHRGDSTELKIFISFFQWQFSLDAARSVWILCVCECVSVCGGDRSLCDLCFQYPAHLTLKPSSLPQGHNRVPHAFKVWGKRSVLWNYLFISALEARIPHAKQISEVFVCFGGLLRI